jgi:hypothetical protein
MLLDEIQLHCMVSFDKYESAKLTTAETSFMNSLISDMPKQILNNKTASENRNKERKQEDSIPDDTSITEEDTTFVEIQRAFKIIEVLGQIIKNRAGTFDKTRVSELLQEIEELGFRILGYLLNTLKDVSFSKWLEARLKFFEKSKKLTPNGMSDADRKKIVEKNIQIMGLLLIISMIYKIFYAVRTDKIVEIQEKISEDISLPAYDMLDVLFQVSYEGLNSEKLFKKLKFLHFTYFDTKNNWAASTLSLLIQHYLNTHHVEPKMRQRICSLFDIKYTPNTVPVAHSMGH